MARLTTGATLDPQTLETITGPQVTLPDPEQPLTHLQFRRFAGCPVCNLHLRQVAQRVDELRAAGVREVAVFHSEAETMRRYQSDLPFDVIADPTKALYQRFGVESSLRSVADPRAWGSLLRGLTASHASNPIDGEGGHLGQPADFLINARGEIVALKYGAHAADQWSVDELLALAAGARA